MDLIFDPLTFTIGSGDEASRRAGQLRLTDVGRIVHERGLEALGMMGRLTREVSDLTTLVRGELTVGIPPMVNLLFPPVVKAFRERYRR